MPEVKLESRPPAGLFPLALWNLVVGLLCCGLVLRSPPPILSSDDVTPPGHAPVPPSQIHRPDYSEAWLLAGLAAGGHALMLLAGAGLLIRKPWGWRLAACTQLLAGLSQAALAIMGPVMIRTASGDYAGFGVLAGQALFAVAGLLAAISLIGCWYVTRPHVKAAFRFAQTV